MAGQRLGTITPPTLVSHAKNQVADRLGNVSVVRTVERGCAYAVQALLVICLSADGEMSAEDQLALLARVRRDAAIRVGSPAAAAVVSAVLGQAGEEYAEHPVVIRRFEQCAGACEARIEVRNRLERPATIGGDL